MRRRLLVMALAGLGLGLLGGCIMTPRAERGVQSYVRSWELMRQAEARLEAAKDPTEVAKATAILEQRRIEYQQTVRGCQETVFGVMACEAAMRRAHEDAGLVPVRP